MKKKLMAVFVVAGMLLAFLTPGIVHADPSTTQVTGVITDSGKPVEGAMVTVKCGAVTKTDTTDKFGTYLVSFAFADCPPGSTVTATAKKDDKTGTKTGRVIGVTTKLNLALVNVDIPEYGLIGGILATGVGVGAVFYKRRRFAQGKAL